MELRRKRAATPQKPSRLQPTEPLHMTTRAASKAASSNGGSSRRGSLYSNGQTSPTVGNDNEGERYPKRRRVSAGSKSTPTGAAHSSQSSSSRPSTRSMSGGNLQPIAESPLPRRKRKRSSGSTAEHISVAQPLKTRTEFERALFSPGQKKQPPRKAKRSSTSSNEQAMGQSETSTSNKANSIADDAQQTVEVYEEHEVDVDENIQESSGSISNGDSNGVTNEQGEDVNVNEGTNSGNGDQEISDQQQTQQTESEDSAEQLGVSQADEDAQDESMNAGNDGHDTNGDEDDAEGDYDEDAELDNSHGELLSLPKQLGITTVDPTPAVSATASPTGSNQDSNIDQESPMKALNSTSMPPGEVPTASQDDGKPVKRLPGRRRAPHANPKVEAALRRQLHLRMAYRAVAKNLKPVLTELAKRSLNDIHKDPEAHTTFSEFPVVKEGLQQHFEGRLAWIHKQKELNKQRLDDILKEQTEMRNRQYEHVARTIQEDMIVRVQHDFLTKLRQQQQEQDDDYSDDEGDDVIPTLRRVTAKGTLRGILGPEYHWRSRPSLETERLFNELHERSRIAQEHCQYDEESAGQEVRPFTTFDPVIREAAEAQRKMKGLLAALGEAAEEVSEPPTAPVVDIPPAPPVIPNNEALGLLVLAEASATSKIAAPVASENTTMAQTDQLVDVPSRLEDLSVPRPSMSRAGSQSTPAPSVNTPAKPAEEQPIVEQRPPTTAPISFSQAVLEPSTTQTAPLLPLNIQPEQQEQRPQSELPQLPSIGQMVGPQSHEPTLPQPVASSASLPAPTPSKPVATDFWSSLALGSYETDAHGKVKLAPKAATRQSSSKETPVNNAPDSVKVEDRHPRQSLQGSSTKLEPLHQRLRSNSDAFGPLLNRLDDLDNSQAKKVPAPKKSLYGPWPRSRNYNPLDRRASTTSSTPQTPQPSLPGIHSRPPGGYGGPYSTPESRHTSYTPAPPPPMPGYPTSTAHSGPYSSAPMYGSAPPPYAYEQRGPYPPLNPYPAPTGFAGLPGAPMSQAQAPPPFYGGPHGLPPPPQQPGGYGPPPPLTSRPPPTPPGYGSQYGGQPILPASHDPRYGPNGTSAAGSAGPAFAQYQQHDGRRRRNQSLGQREFQHYHGPR